MSRRIASVLPAALASSLQGSNLRGRVGETHLLISADADGWPHVAMLSAGEVLATGSSELRLALLPASQTTANLIRSGTAVLMTVIPPATYYVRLRCRQLPNIAVLDRKLAAFSAEIVEISDDQVAYAEVQSGIRFRLIDPEETLRAWTEALGALRESALA